jgi:hypothetical protein
LLEMAMVAEGWMRFSESEMKPMAVTFRFCGLNRSKLQQGQASIRRISGAPEFRYVSCP